MALSKVQITIIVFLLTMNLLLVTRCVPVPGVDENSYKEKELEKSKESYRAESRAVKESFKEEDKDKNPTGISKKEEKPVKISPRSNTEKVEKKSEDVKKKPQQISQIEGEEPKPESRTVEQTFKKEDFEKHEGFSRNEDPKMKRFEISKSDREKTVKASNKEEEYKALEKNSVDISKTERKKVKPGDA